MATNRRPFVADRANDLVEQFGSPLYVFDEARLRESYRSLRAALDDHYPDSRIHYAVKANYNLGVLSVLRDAGAAAEAFASCERSAALEAGFDPSDVLLTGQNRTQESVEAALNAGVDRLLVDNETELERVTAAAAATGTRPGVLVRANPAMELPTHPDIATATRESKFGLDVESGRALAVARRAADAEAVHLDGVQLHVGSQITAAEPYAVAARSMVEFAAAIRDETGVEIGVLDLGGGFPVAYDDAVPAAEDVLETLADAVRAACDAHDLAEPRLLIEPGRRLVAEAGALLTTVGVVKNTPHADFAILDAGSNLVGHWPYPIYAAEDAPADRRYHVAGPLCYSGDVLAEDVDLPELSRGDVVVVDRVGAYALSGASNTNATPRPAAVLLDGYGDPHVVRERETCADVTRHDAVPGHLTE
jgi:diaminopimelate decarboxylase